MATAGLVSFGYFCFFCDPTFDSPSLKVNTVDHISTRDFLEISRHLWDQATCGGWHHDGIAMIYPRPMRREVEIACSEPILGKLPVNRACILRTENWFKAFQSTSLHQFKIMVDLTWCRKWFARRNLEEKVTFCGLSKNPRAFMAKTLQLSFKSSESNSWFQLGPEECTLCYIPRTQLTSFLQGPSIFNGQIFQNTHLGSVGNHRNLNPTNTLRPSTTVHQEVLSHRLKIRSWT